MISRQAIPATVLFALCVSSGLFAQKPSARDSFWSSNDLISVTPNPAAHKQPRTGAASHQGSASSSGSRSSSSPEPQQGAQPQRDAQLVQLVSMNGYGTAPTLVRAAESRLGLRCSIMRRGADGEYSEVTAGTTFHSGDHIRLSFLANHAGYFYVIQKGSTGAWSPIFPAANSAPDANKISAGQLQTVPSGTKSFAFDQHPGDEKLFVILSRAPISDIDRAIQNLKSGKPASTAPPAQPDDGPMLEAENHIPDAFVTGLASRDLTLVDEQKVDESTKDDAQGEKAIYVVTKTSASDTGSQVVLSLDLRHE